MIGRIASAYARGRFMALAGNPRPEFRPNNRAAKFEQLGYDDETERMRRERRLAQLRLPLEDVQNALTEAAPEV